jgi:mannose-6-phosphate isomerase-like protein (cupin superfamily)
MAVDTRTYTGAATEAPLLGRIDPYAEWQEREGVPIVKGVYIPDMRSVELGLWSRKGVNGAICYLDGDDGCDIHIAEIPAGGSTTPEHHLYDEAIYILSGRGAASIWFDDSTKQTFEWSEGSFFAVPTNAWYQMFNGSGSEPVRYFSVTNLPSLMRQFHNEGFIFDNPYAFTDRYAGEQDYFSGEGKLWGGRLWETNFEPDVRRMKLWEWKERGGGGTNAFFLLAGGTINSHISRFQTGCYKKGHRSPSGSHLFILNGDGYTTTQRRDDEDMIRYEWKPGSLFLSGAGSGLWYHQHFNVSPTSATYLVVGVNKSRKYATSRWEAETPTDRNTADLDVKQGGIQTEYPDEDPEVHRVFEEELRRRGVPCRMKALSPFCTGELGPSADGEWGDEH